jgi:hypothetical protein
MRRMAVRIAAALSVSLAGPAFAVDMTEEIQDDEQPGSEIEIDIGGGEATIERKSGAPVFAPGDAPVSAPSAGEPLEVPDDPDAPAAEDPVDAELPGEGPESLSGPDDDDSLPD